MKLSAVTAKRIRTSSNERCSWPGLEAAKRFKKKNDGVIIDHVSVNSQLSRRSFHHAVILRPIAFAPPELIRECKNKCGPCRDDQGMVRIALHIEQQPSQVLGAFMFYGSERLDAKYSCWIVHCRQGRSQALLDFFAYYGFAPVAVVIDFWIYETCHTKDLSFFYLLVVSAMADLFQGERRRSEATSAKIPPIA